MTPSALCAVRVCTAHPLPGPALCVSPTLFSGAPAPSLLTADIPGPGAPETFRGLQQTVRLLSPSDVGRVGGGQQARARGWGDCVPSPPQRQAHGEGEAAAVLADGLLGRWGGPPLLTALPGLASAYPSPPHSFHKALTFSPQPLLPLSPLLALLQPKGPPCCPSNTPGTVMPQGLCMHCAHDLQIFSPCDHSGCNSKRPSLHTRLPGQVHRSLPMSLKLPYQFEIVSCVYSFLSYSPPPPQAGP